MQSETVEALSPESIENPYDLYRFLHEESPVHWDANIGAFLVSRYDDVIAILRDPQTFSSSVGAMTRPPAPEAIAIIAQGLPPANTLITADPPEHGKYRSLVSRAFTPRRVEKIRDHITELAHRLVDDFIDAGEVELVHEFAAPLPLTIIAEQLGVPHSQIGDFKRWSDAFLEFIGGLASDERSVECAREIIECQEYFTQRIEDYRTDPQDDMLGVLLRAKLADERPLNPAEMTSILQQFMLAGNETTTSSIAATQRYLIEQPDLLEEVRNDRNLIPEVIEEIIRLASPVQNQFRVTTRETEIAGVTIPPATKIGVMLGAANRDPNKFPEPDRIDPRRDNVREHLAFGHGNHYCIGAGLARLESTVALDVLLDRLENPRFAEGKNDFTHNPMFIARGLKKLYLEFDA
ncbi:MAG: cytochrome P450 [Myxococcota bacterium]|jgi:cytochrome P450|nr:cytochrome P450 [Myxococcota bacterium]